MKKNFKIIELKNLSWTKNGNKPFWNNKFGLIDEFLTKIINPKNLSNEEWYKENKWGIKYEKRRTKIVLQS